MNTQSARDHGGGLDAAISRFGGQREDWLDLSTGINPVPYAFDAVTTAAWTVLPDTAAEKRLKDAARAFWNIPDSADILVAGGASALIAQIPTLAERGQVTIAKPTYNEHEAAFRNAGWSVNEAGGDASVVVHPNNPDGVLWSVDTLASAKLRVIDESFCDVTPDHSLMFLGKNPGTIVLKSFGKFWGLAGLRLGFAIGDPVLLTDLGERIGPWAASGPALEIGTQALTDGQWAVNTRKRLAKDANRMDDLMSGAGAEPVGGTDLFRLYNVDNAARWQNRLVQSRVWSRIFPYSDTWIRLGLPHPERWSQLEDAL